jgi:hypothetical protein
MPRIPADAAEGGGDAATAANCNGLIGLNIDAEEMRLINVLQALDRASRRQATPS